MNTCLTKAWIISSLVSFNLIYHMFELSRLTKTCLCLQDFCWCQAHEVLFFYTIYFVMRELALTNK